MIARTVPTKRLGDVSRLFFFLPNSNLNLRVKSNLFSNSHLTKLWLRKAALEPCSINNETHPPTKTLDGARPLIQSRRGTSELHSHVPFDVKPKIETKGKRSYNKPMGNPLTAYVKLTKPNLTILVTLSSICSYAISPNSANLSNLSLLTLGTALCSGSANAINMAREPEFDRQMSRTSNRPIVKGELSPKSAFGFAFLSGTTGFMTLYFGVNPIVASLGLFNIVLYSWIYTSLKRKSIINTWVGAIVGAIPPLMGWAASSSLNEPGAWCLAALLYAWQFPHFNALSHNIAAQYKSAGYVMTAAENPKLNARVALRYSLLMFPICFGLSYFDVTDWVFSLDSLIPNTWLSILSFKFWKQQSLNYGVETASIKGIEAANAAARKLFWCSVWHLPVVLILAMLHKKGQWDRLFFALGLSTTDDTKEPL